MKFSIVSFVFLAALSAALFAPVLFGGKMAYDGEYIGMFYAGGFFLKDALMRGASVLWNPGVVSGFPTYLSLYVGVHFPLHRWLFAVLPALDAFHTSLLVAFFFSAATSYLFGRRIGFSHIGSLLVALSYVLSHKFNEYFTGLFYSYGYAMLPAVLFAIIWFHGARSRLQAVGAIVFGIASVTIGLLAGFQQLVLYGLVFSAAFSFYLDIVERRGIVGLKRFMTTIAFLAMVTGGIILSLPQVVPTFVLLPETVRTPHYTAESSSFPHPVQLLGFIFPPNAIRELPYTPGLPLYAGAATVVFALAAMLFFRTRRTWFFCGSYLFILAMGLHVPIIAWLNEYAPIFSRVSNVNRWLHVGNFALAVLGAYGFERLRAAPRDFFGTLGFRRFRNGVIIASVILLLGSATVAVGFRALELGTPWGERAFAVLVRGRALRLPPEHYRAVYMKTIRASQATLSVTEWRFAIPVLLYPALALLLAARRRLGSSGFAASALLLAAVTISSDFIGSYALYLVPASLLKTVPAAVRAMTERESDLRSYRIMSFLPGEGFFVALADTRTPTIEEAAVYNRESLTHNSTTIHGIDNAFGLEVLRTLRQNQLLNTVVNPTSLHVFDSDLARGGGRLDQITNKDVIRPVTISEKMNDLSRRLPLLSMMNVKYILSPFPSSDRALRPIPLPPDPTLGITFHLYENPRVLPRAYPAERPEQWKGSDRDLLIAVADALDFKTQTFIECADCLPSDFTSGSGSVRVVSYDNGMIRLVVFSDQPSWVVVSETLVPGWEARIDGSRVPIRRANYLFQAVRVPPGTHTVEFNYRGEWRNLIPELL